MITALAAIGPLITRYAVAAAAACAVMGLMYQSTVQRGVNKERARVEAIGNKTDAKARKARKAAEAKPSAALSRYCRDCK
jgi:hypothetical protein